MKGDQLKTIENNLFQLNLEEKKEYLIDLIFNEWSTNDDYEFLKSVIEIYTDQVRY